ncbi:gibberellin 2-beta-dioxygenase 6-like [Telopea speciosissima]|uniref:gibberellin 2-beta-dioxygenase 6-like n=1 Tax=Telopea speciosissima TaxID=54955 RepID=UPI001CC6DDFD|nr:gibberellin 2-beta-dioxygenase 6-like [Telopea speciosissima]
MKTSSDPPLLAQYGSLLRQPTQILAASQRKDQQCEVIEECELPLIDLGGLRSCNHNVRQACEEAIARASSEWGFFQVVNHGISPKLIGEMRREQVKVFETPFARKASCGLLNNSYTWGNPTATSLKHFFWSEAFHIPLTKISDEACYGEFSTLREVLEKFAAAMSSLARLLAGVLAENLGQPEGVLEEICNESSCFLRLNCYPKCPIPGIFGLVPHTDSDFLTILHQDQVGGLQLMKDSKWVAVKPNQDALIINIGDLFQAWSNNEYKSVEHKVISNGKVERYSIAYFLCPSYDCLIKSCREPSIYRKFSFGEYRKQVQEDVKKTGHKVGLSRFLL